MLKISWKVVAEAVATREPEVFLAKTRATRLNNSGFRWPKWGEWNPRMPNPLPPNCIAPVGWGRLKMAWKAAVEANAAGEPEVFLAKTSRWHHKNACDQILVGLSIEPILLALATPSYLNLRPTARFSPGLDLKRRLRRIASQQISKHRPTISPKAAAKFE